MMDLATGFPMGKETVANGSTLSVRRGRPVASGIRAWPVAWASPSGLPGTGSAERVVGHSADIEKYHAGWLSIRFVRALNRPPRRRHLHNARQRGAIELNDSQRRELVEGKLVYLAVANCRVNAA
jgi:hypothetical protein